MTTDTFQDVDVLIKSNNRAMRKDNCRTRWMTFDDGQVKTKIWLCGLPECDYCRKKIADNIKERISRAVAHFGSIRLVHESRKEVNKLVRYFNTEYYLRLPQHDGTDFVFVVTDSSVGEELSSEIFNSIDFDELSKRPNGSRQSGDLGKDKKKEEELAYEIVAYENIVDKPNLILPSYKKATCQMGTVYKPVNVQELQKLIDKRNNLFVNNFLGLGGLVYETKMVRKKIKKLLFLTDVKIS